MEGKINASVFRTDKSFLFIEDICMLDNAYNKKIESQGELPEEIVMNIKRSGGFRVTIPRRLGGSEYSLAETLNVIKSFSAVNASLGWNYMIGIQTPILLAYFPQDVFTSLYSENPDLVIANSSAALGLAVPSLKGYSITGKWPFASGCLFADFFIGQNALSESNAADEGKIINALFDKSQFKIIKTWNSLGLQATGSHQVEVDSAEVSLDYTYYAYQSISFIDSFPFNLPLRLHMAFHMVAVALGIAQAALSGINLSYLPSADNIKSSRRMLEVHQILFEVGKMEAQFNICDCALMALVDKAAMATKNTEDEYLKIYGNLIHIAEVCEELVNGCYKNAGTRAIQKDNLFQQYLRDIKTVVQHVNLSRSVYYAVGAKRCGHIISHSIL